MGHFALFIRIFDRTGFEFFHFRNGAFKLWLQSLKLRFGKIHPGKGDEKTVCIISQSVLL